MLDNVGIISFNSKLYKVVELYGARVISDIQLAEILQFSTGVRHVRRIVKRNNLEVICLKKEAVSNKEVYSFLTHELGYTTQSVTQANNIYFFDIDNLLYFLSASEIKEDILSSFIRLYFNMSEEEIRFRHTLRKEFGFAKILEEVTKSITLFEQQYSVDNYRVDFYSEDFNLVVEYDENGHDYTQDKDKLRQKHIENKLGCHFIRVKEGQESVGLGKVVEYLFKFSFEKSRMLNEV